MAEFERVPLRPRPSRNWLPTIGLAFAAFLALAIVKPWESSQNATADAESPAPTFYVRPTERTGPRDYDPRLFGGREPDPAWELWPAGYVVQFGLAGPVKVHGQDGSSPPPDGTAAPSAVPTSSTAPFPVASADAPEPSDPGDVVDLGPSDHLVALGINTPLDVRVEKVTLWRVEEGRASLVPIVRLPTLWESDHFIVIAPEDPAAGGQPTVWEPGLYRIDLTTSTKEIREVRLRVRPPLE